MYMYLELFALLLIVALYVLLLVKRFVNVLCPGRDTAKQKCRRVILLLLIVALSAVLCYGWDYGYSLFLQAGMFALVMEPVNWLVLLVTGRKDTRGGRFYRCWRRIFGLCLVPLILAGVMTVYGSFHIKDVKVNRYTVESEKLSESLTVLAVSDLHYPLVMTEERLSGLISEMQQENPDLVLLVGDIVDEGTTKEEMQWVFSEFGKLQSTYGTYYVYGNHDDQQYETDKCYTLEELNAAVSNAGITLLADSFTELRDDLTLVGRKDYSELRADLPELMEEVREDTFILVMDHQPQEYSLEEQEGTDLVISGHTHDGQLFPIGHIITLFHMADVTWGEAHFGDTTAIVSSGIVGWGFPIRTQGNSEYLVITLDPK